jgi:hypothetical protein
MQQETPPGRSRDGVSRSLRENYREHPLVDCSRNSQTWANASLFTASPQLRVGYLHNGGAIQQVFARSPATSARYPSTISRITLIQVEIHKSARRHRVADADISHAYDHIVAWLRLDDDPPRYLLAGPDRAGNLLELVILAVEDEVLVIHAMALRPTTQFELFGDETS